MSLVIIGMDPHKRSATIEVMAGDEAILGGGRFATDAAGYAAMLARVRQWPERVWAVEGSALGMLSARPREVSVAPGRLGLAAVAPVTVVAKGKAHDIVTNAATVGELLSAMRIEPDGDDRIDPPPGTPLRQAPRIAFTTIRSATIARIESLALPPMTRVTERLPAGSSEVVSPGRAGRILRIYRIRFVNGRRVGQSLVFSRVVRPGLRATRLVGAAHNSMVGEASWYYVDSDLTAASPWLPFGTTVTVTNLATGADVTVVINDRGPFGGRLIDLSEAAFSRIAPLGQGVASVRITW